ncbi:thiamine phosphate synthase [Brochothrix thermosphacta]|uniref:thiamine phosphate synthase n=1 Tax=Brochothrix thermosphacta TaxID=2756 RepID=UPI00083F65EC|nr:thiamine phosphate synthase [Brochothrix thermosphacta]ODJ58767.1 thiamine-phosphate diphosphorylase [Brochothrix thermosphacta]
MINWRAALNVYFIAGTQDVPMGQTLTDMLEEALDAGITAFQYREKGPRSLSQPDDIERVARACQKLCLRYDIPFIVNDDIALAMKIQADAIHIGQSDTPLAETVEQVKNSLAIGLSTNTLSEFEEAMTQKDLAYIGIGPVFNTVSKIDAQATVGIELLKDCQALSYAIPQVAIGGITSTNVQIVRETGIEGIAVISEIAQSIDKQTTVRKLKVKPNVQLQRNWRKLKVK